MSQRRLMLPYAAQNGEISQESLAGALANGTHEAIILHHAGKVAEKAMQMTKANDLMPGDCLMIEIRMRVVRDGRDDGTRAPF